jgi:transposase-like protein
MTKKRKRRYRSAEEKARLLRRHLEDGEPVSKICEEEELQPSVFYQWKRDMLARLESTMAMKPGKGGGRERELERRLAKLEAKLSRKDAVIAEISEEYVALKKELGEL